jgi:glycine/D-amino acid oxidase-like deaminating enzyme
MDAMAVTSPPPHAAIIGVGVSGALLALQLARKAISHASLLLDAISFRYYPT